MTTFFFICFGVGAGFVIISVILGNFLDIIDADNGPLPFNLSLVAIFVAVFGGLGLLIYPTRTLILDIGLPLLGAFALSFVVFRFLLLPIQRLQNTNTHEKQSLIGHVAKVAETIPQGGYGKITYTINEKIVGGPAKSEDGSEISRGAIVEIVYIEKNTYHVREKTNL